MFDKTSKQGTFFLDLFSLVEIVDKLKLVKDVHKYNDYINDTNLVLASDEVETIGKHLKMRKVLLCETVIKSLEDYGEELSLDP